MRVSRTVLVCLALWCILELVSGFHKGHHGGGGNGIFLALGLISRLLEGDHGHGKEHHHHHHHIKYVAMPVEHHGHHGHHEHHGLHAHHGGYIFEAEEHK